MCWDRTPLGVFESEAAKQIGDALYAALFTEDKTSEPVPEMPEGDWRFRESYNSILEKKLERGWVVAARFSSEREAKIVAASLNTLDALRQAIHDFTMNDISIHDLRHRVEEAFDTLDGYEAHLQRGEV